MEEIVEDQQENSGCCLKPKKPKARDLYNVLKDNSEYSSLGGMIFIFISDLYWASRVFWLVIVLSMICLGLYWSWYLYMGNYNIFYV